MVFSVWCFVFGPLRVWPFLVFRFWCLVFGPLRLNYSMAVMPTVAKGNAPQTPKTKHQKRCTFALQFLSLPEIISNQAKLVLAKLFAND